MEFVTCAKQMTEERLSIFWTDAERFEHFLLQLGLVNPDAAAADLDAVQNNVVSFRADFAKLLVIE